MDADAVSVPTGRPTRIVYSLAHPSDRLDDERAGHLVRANQLLSALERSGCTVTRVEAGSASGTEVATRTYRSMARRLLPARVATALRDVLRIAQNGRHARRLERVVRRGRFDVLIETHVGFSTAGARAASRTGTFFVLDDVSPATEDEEIYDVRLRRAARRRRRSTLERADLLVVVTTTARDALVAEGVDRSRMAVIANGVSPAALAEHPQASRRRAELAARDDIVVAYAGSFQPFHRVDLALSALAGCRHRDRLLLVLVGDGDDKAACVRQAAGLGLGERVRFIGRVPNEEVGGYLQAADICLLPGTERYMNPMKLYEYLAAGRPIIAPAMPVVTEIVGDAGAALLFPPGDVTGLGAALDAAVDRGSGRMAMGRRARALATDNTWDARAHDLVEAINRSRRPPIPPDDHDHGDG